MSERGINTTEICIFLPEDDPEKEKYRKIHEACKKALIDIGIPEEKIRIYTPKYTPYTFVFDAKKARNGILKDMLIKEVVIEQSSCFVFIKYIFHNHNGDEKKFISIREEDLCDRETAEKLIKKYKEKKEV